MGFYPPTKSLSLCQQAYPLHAGVARHVNHIGHVPPEADSTATSTMVEALSDIGRHGQKVGAMLAAETVPLTDRPAASRAV